METLLLGTRLQWTPNNRDGLRLMEYFWAKLLIV